MHAHATWKLFVENHAMCSALKLMLLMIILRNTLERSVEEAMEALMLMISLSLGKAR